MGNTSAKPHPRQRNKKQVHWKAADRPAQPGKPHLVSETEATPDVITIRWNPPYKDGGSPITGYLVEHRRSGSPHWVRATPLLVPFPELKLSGLEPGWRYQFRVSAENAVGMSVPSELSEPLTVTLQRSAVTAPRFTQELSDTIALENEKVEFVAHFLGQPPPKICWFKDGFEIFSSRRTRILTESDCSVLTIHQSALCDEGEIKCTATNKAGHASTKAKLSLEAPPSIRLPRQYEDGLLFEIGEAIRLKVSVAGQPIPLVFWSHNGQTIKNDERYEIDNSNKSSTLKVDEARRTDRGEYQIKAVNKLGQDVVSFLVTVTDKPSPPGKARVVMNLGRSVTLAWNEPEDDGGCKIGNYIIEYYRVGWDVWLKAATSRQLTAVLGDLIEGSEYKFRVKAESPYGVSEPSQESETVFIPDPKRGLLTAPVRSRSQPRDLSFAQNQPPVLPERKHKPRSQSTTRVDSPSQRVRFDMPNSGIPVRPERTKIKSPPKTPELSPTALRREIANTQTIDKEIFDRATITRELAYGSPEIKVKKPDEEILPRPRSRSRSPSPLVMKQPPKNTIQIIDYKRPRSPSPLITRRSPSPLITRRSPSPASKGRSPSPLIKSRSPSPSRNFIKVSPTLSPVSQRRKLSKSDQLNGSSEFMLVLLPNGHKSRRDSDGDVEFDESLIPPPLSLSAPELGAEPPPFTGLKYSSSSSELLHERALLRFYEAAEAEEQELKQRLENKSSTERQPSNIPKIQINNKDDEDIVGLERTASFKRRYSGGINRPQQFIWAQRRHSLRNSDDSEVIENKLHKFALTVDEKREIMMNRKRSKSEEQEEEELEKIRANARENRRKLERRNNLDVVDLDKWEAEVNQKEEEEYEESLSEEEESESEDERIYDQVPSAHSSEEEDRTYHPRTITSTNNPSSKINEEPFEILTEPKKLPDPSFIPKPILKQHKPESNSVEVNIDHRQRSLSLAENPKSDGTSLAKRGSLPWTPVVNEKPKLMTDFSLSARRSSSPMVLAQPLPVHSLSAIASISGIAAASIVIPKAALAKKVDEEEAKIVVDHYSDIVRSYGQKRNKSESQTNTNRPYVETNSFIRNPNDSNNVENTRNLNGHLSRRRNDSDSSSQRSSSPTRFGRITKRKGSPMVLNREVFASDSEMKVKISAKSPDSSRASSRTSSKSPGRLRKSNKSPSPLDVSRKTTMEFSTQTKKSPSPPNMGDAGRNRAPMMKEIMTQTSLCIETIVTPLKRKLTQTELERCAEITVRTTVDYITDLAMLVVACWLYVFSNELLAVPVLIILVYRQLQEAVRKRLPKWMLPKPKES